MIGKLGNVAENIPKVYASGYDTGHTMGYQQGESVGYEIGHSTGLYEGKQAECDAFWDDFQRNGTLGDYRYAFSMWKINIFKPKYNLCPVNAGFMFNSFNSGAGHAIINLTAHLENLGVSLDTSKCTNFDTMFYYAWINRVPELDTRAASNVNNIFNSATRTITVDKIILKDDGSQTFTDSFYQCNVLANIEFEGVIGNSIDLKWSQLSAKSFVSTVEHLSSTTSGKSATFKSSAVNNADWSTTEYESWDALIATKPNWSFSLA